ncbi:MAG: nucleoside kinase [Halanaerobiales bacterium]
MIEINANGSSHKYKQSVKIETIVKELAIPNKHRIVAAIIDNTVYDLDREINKDCSIDFLRREDVLGNRIYRRSLFMLMARAIYNLFPDSRLAIEYSLSNGIYCELKMAKALNPTHLGKIKKEMTGMVKKNLPIKRMTVKAEEAIRLYKKQKFYDKVKVVQQSEREQFVVYELDGYYDYFYYHMVPGTGYLDKFDLHYRYPGFVLLFPQKDSPDEVPGFINQEKIAGVYTEAQRLGKIMGVETVNEMNHSIVKGDYGRLIRIAEGLHEKNIARIADKITENIREKQIVLIAGPTSSGKTTFTHRLSTQLMINDLKPVAISIDNYFVNRENTPRDEDGNYDFESIKAIDLDLLNNHLIRLLQGREVEIPVYSFKNGQRIYNGTYLQIEENQPLLIEGIHGLNEKLTSVIPRGHKFKIYVSALTQINIDSHNRIPTTDTRMIRRIIRDHKYRGHTASQTIDLWPSVRKGEEKYIFPYQENADIMFNSALIYEFAALKKFAVPLLAKIDSSKSSYYEAQRLLEILSCFREIPLNQIPNTSILREFIGNSVFRKD